jgi:hypothetical protein
MGRGLDPDPDLGRLGALVGYLWGDMKRARARRQAQQLRAGAAGRWLARRERERAKESRLLAGAAPDERRAWDPWRRT